MTLPFSDLSDDLLKQKVDQLFFDVNSLEPILVRVGAEPNLVTLSQNVLLLLESMRRELDGDREEAALRIKIAIGSLSELLDAVSKPGAK